ncbi:hypothetical protein [Nonomuraea sp. JJY05]|uniref:hypothetical protein n=1 Tax=Nonomuraea sp. JJY05 TaxID=3350255 RepID=UPI00373E28B6
MPALTRARLQQVDQGYLRAETISAANARLRGCTPSTIRPAMSPLRSPDAGSA